MERITVFRANDGQMFDNENDCLAHEGKCKFFMFDRKGNRTEHGDNAFVVYIPYVKREDYLQPGAIAFIKQCEKEHTYYDGINESSSGLYIWDDDYKEEYIHLDEDAISAIKHINFESCW